MVSYIIFILECVSQQFFSLSDAFSRSSSFVNEELKLRIKLPYYLNISRLIMVFRVMNLDIALELFFWNYNIFGRKLFYSNWIPFVNSIPSLFLSNARLREIDYCFQLTLFESYQRPKRKKFRFMQGLNECLPRPTLE